MEKISAVIITYKEEKETIIKLMKSLNGVDEIIIDDDGSSEKVIKLMKSLGAKLFKRDSKKEIVTKEDVQDFKIRFGFPASFVEGSCLYNGSETRNKAISYASNEWIFTPDSDEIVTWNLKNIRKMLPLCDQIKCKLIQSHNEKGEANYEFDICKLFRKSVCKYVGRVHEVVVGGGRYTFATDMKIDHWQKPRAYRLGVLPRLEYAVLKDGDTRTKFYLAREYFYGKQWEKAIQIFNEYLKTATWLPEITDAYIKLAQSYWQIQRGDKSREYCTRAVINNPQCKEALFLMSVYYNEPQSNKWKELAKQATNEDSLFKPII